MSNVVSNERITMTVEQAAGMIGLGRNAAYEAVRRGDIPSVRIGGRIFVPVASFRKMFGLDVVKNETGTEVR